MNVHRVAALLRELADAIEQPDEEKRPRRRPLVKAEGPEPSPKMQDRVLRSLRNAAMGGR